MAERVFLSVRSRSKSQDGRGLAALAGRYPWNP